MDVGFVGLGNIGGHCAKHLLDAGRRATVFDIDEAAAGRLASAGARSAEPAAEAGLTARVPPPVDAP